MCLSELPVELMTMLGYNLDSKLELLSLNQTFYRVLLPIVWKECPISNFDFKEVNHLKLLYKYGSLIRKLTIPKFSLDFDLLSVLIRWCPNLVQLDVCFEDPQQQIDDGGLDVDGFLDRVRKRNQSQMLAKPKLNLLKLKVKGSLKYINALLHQIQLDTLTELDVEVKDKFQDGSHNYLDQMELFHFVNQCTKLTKLKLNLYQLFTNQTIDLTKFNLLFQSITKSNLTKLDLNLGVLPNTTDSNLLLTSILKLFSTKFPSLKVLNLKLESMNQQIDYFKLLNYLNTNFNLTQFHCFGTNLNNTKLDLKGLEKFKFKFTLPTNVHILNEKILDTKLETQNLNKEIEPLNLSSLLLHNQPKPSLFGYFKSWFF